MVPATGFEPATLGLKARTELPGRLLKPPAELDSPQVASPWLLEPPRLGNTKWLRVDFTKSALAEAVECVVAEEALATTLGFNFSMPKDRLVAARKSAL